MKLIKWLDEHLEETLLIILLVVIACVMMLQVIVRKMPGIPSLTWAEEFCRFCWIWSVFISLPYTIRIDSMLRVSAMLDMLPRGARKYMNVAVDVITMLSMGMLACYSVPVITKIYNGGEVSPAMLWPMWAIYSIMLLGFAAAALRGLQMIFLHLSDKHVLLTMEEQARSDAALEAAAAKEGGDA